MRVELIVNPRSGKGRAVAAAGAIESALRSAGHEVGRSEITDDAPIGDADAAVVVGGDGTLHHRLDELIAHGVPVYHAPMGTENLFGREFGMSPEPPRVVAAVERGDVVALDVGRCNGVPFCVMASVGFDAEVIHRLDAKRTGGISHFSYLGPIMRAVVTSRAPSLTVTVDDEELVTGRHGTVIIANLRQYAMRLDPAARANGTDGQLDVVFMPHKRSWLLAWWALLARVRMLRSSAMVKSARGGRVVVESDTPFSVQLDGEASMTNQTRLELTIEPGAMKVLRA